jgi:hypothetical protein
MAVFRNDISFYLTIVMQYVKLAFFKKIAHCNSFFLRQTGFYLKKIEFKWFLKPWNLFFLISPALFAFLSNNMAVSVAFLLTI